VKNKDGVLVTFGRDSCDDVQYPDSFKPVSRLHCALRLVTSARNAETDESAQPAADSSNSITHLVVEDMGG